MPGSACEQPEFLSLSFIITFISPLLFSSAGFPAPGCRQLCGRPPPDFISVASLAMTTALCNVLMVLFAAASLASPLPLFPSIVTEVPGRAPSTNFIAEVYYDAVWTRVFVFESSSRAAAPSGQNTTGYFAHLENWTISWVSSQLPSDGSALLLRVSRANGAPIHAAVTHPESAAVRVFNVSEGVLTLIASASTRVAVDIDGALDETDTGPSYAGPPIHSFAWFVDSAPAAGLPDPDSPNSIVVRPGDALPNASSLNPSRWPTVIFAPGVHRAAAAANNWTVLTMSSNTRYFLCAGAVVHAAFVGMASQGNVVVDGFGIISGEDMVRGGEENNSPVGLQMGLNPNTTIEGVTLVDFPNHHIIVGSAGEDNAGSPNVNTLANCKVLGWRANGDGLHVFRNWTVRDLFMRTQDDGMYLSCGDNCTSTFSRITLWCDANGAAFIFSAGGGQRESVSLTDSAVIYARSSWAFWTGGRIFSQRGAVSGSVMAGVTIDGVVVEDRFPSLNAFQIDMTSANSSPLSDAAFANVTFRNIAIANWSTVRESLDKQPLPYGIPNLCFAGPGAAFRNIAFDNVSIAGQNIADGLSDTNRWNFSESSTLINVTVDGTPFNEVI